MGSLRLLFSAGTILQLPPSRVRPLHSYRCFAHKTMARQKFYYESDQRPRSPRSLGNRRIRQDYSGLPRVLCSEWSFRLPHPPNSGSLAVNITIGLFLLPFILFGWATRLSESGF
jgi:hypothetical protein